MFKKLTQPLHLLVALLIVIVVSSFAASLVQNSFFSVRVEKVSFETGHDNGVLSGYLYIPRGVDADHPAPAIVLTHGYLNNKETQEIGAIEMSRRGYVVLAFDMYDHGDSTWDTPGQFNFYVFAVYDAVQYMYDQDYVLKDANGNGMIAVSGHSMGGFSDECAVVLDEMDFATNGYRKIAVSLTVGADFRYVPFADPMDYFQNRSSGVIAAHYDQFFYDNDAVDPSITMVYKDYVNDPVGLAFLGRTDIGTAESGVFYPVDGGLRVIYNTDETHPQQTWSLQTGRDEIEFFNRAFEYQLGLHGDLGTLSSYGIDIQKTGQVWWLKEAFTLIALLALIGLIFPAFMLLTSLPVFNKVYVDNKPLEPEFKPKKDSIYLAIKTGVVLLAFFFATFLVKSFMDRTQDNLNVIAVICWILFGIALAAIATFWILTILKKNKGDEVESLLKLTWKVTYYGIAVIVVSMLYRWLLVNAGDIIQTGHYWSAPSTNTIVYWAMASAGLILLINILAGFYFNNGEENPFGLKASPVQIGVSLLTALALVTGILFIVALIGWIFLTDFRFYTYAIQIFNSQQFVAAWRYIPLFLVYYFAAGLAVFYNTKNVKGWLGDLFAALLLAGPVVLFLIIQYIPLYSSGTAFWPTFHLSSILCVGLVPTLSFAAIIMRRFALRTGNIWTGVFFTTVFFTLITLANTTVYLLAAA